MGQWSKTQTFTLEAGQCFFLMEVFQNGNKKENKQFKIEQRSLQPQTQYKKSFSSYTYTPFCIVVLIFALVFLSGSLLTSSTNLSRERRTACRVVQYVHTNKYDKKSLHYNKQHPHKLGSPLRIKSPFLCNYTS